MTVRTIALTALFAGLTAGSAVAWHNHLTKSVPAANETVAESPSTIRLWFSEKPVAKFTSITLLGADSSKVDIGRTRTTDDSLSVAVDVPQPLAPGKYVVRWRTAGDDGHAIRGSYRFSVGQ